ncbi:MAG: GerMN domain-containing protein [Bacillota bacterium]|nr:GerMN domain-containing protein [Bacillota bacterium]
MKKRAGERRISAVIVVGLCVGAALAWYLRPASPSRPAGSASIPAPTAPASSPGVRPEPAEGGRGAQPAEQGRSSPRRAPLPGPAVPPPSPPGRAPEGADLAEGERMKPTDRGRIYLVRLDPASGREVLVPVWRALPATSDRTVYLSRLVRELLKGPTAEEQSRGLYSPIPPGARLRGVEVRGEVAYLDFNPQIQPAGGSAWVEVLLDALTYTATEVPGVRRVVLQVNGEQVGTAEHPFSSEGALFDALERSEAATPVLAEP